MLKKLSTFLIIAIALNILGCPPVDERLGADGRAAHQAPEVDGSTRLVWGRHDREPAVVGSIVTGVVQSSDGADLVVRVVENPISIRQAFWTPYKKLVRMIEEQAAMTP